jgi:predicted acylesterase/phospholipase RssA
LLRDTIPLDVVVGVSAGAIVAGYYAAVGVDVDDLVADAGTLCGRHLLAYSLSVRLNERFGDALRPLCGVIPHRLEQLETASFERLHQGVWRLGIACHDITTGQPCYYATGDSDGVALPDVVRASASIPGLFPAIQVTSGGRQRALIDGGISDPVPLAFARRLGATHLIVSDARWVGTARAATKDVVWIRPRMASTGTLWAPRRSLTATVEQGDEAVTPDAMAEIRAWLNSTIASHGQSD